MIPAILIGRKGSKGFPSKNKAKVLNKHLFEYPLTAALNSPFVDFVCVATDDEEITDIIKNKYDTSNIVFIDRPKELNTSKAKAEDVYIHCYNEIKSKSIKFDTLVLMMMNAPCITSNMINEMIQKLNISNNADSIITVSKYEMFTPFRVRNFVEDGTVYEYTSQEYLNECEINCNRDSGSQKDFCYFDCSCAVIKNRCLDKIGEIGRLPQRWIGSKIIPYEQKIPALDVDYEWQLGQIEYWVKNYGKK